MQNEDKREPLIERRARQRAPLRWAVKLFRRPTTEPVDPLLNEAGNHEMTHSIDTVTRNVSSNGFYCVVPESFPTEHPVECQITIAPTGSYAQEEEVLLQGIARIVRLENLNLEGVGMACQLEDYAIVKVPLHPPRREYAVNGNGKAYAKSGRASQ